MGYWEHGEDGSSFVAGEDPDNQLIWGDEPADIVDDAIWQITIAFARDVGRMPSKKEIIAGIKFTTNALDRFAEEPKDAPRLTKEQSIVIYQHGYAATGGDVSPSQERMLAISRVNDVLGALYKDNYDDLGERE